MTYGKNSFPYLVPLVIISKKLGIFQTRKLALIYLHYYQLNLFLLFPKIDWYKLILYMFIQPTCFACFPNYYSLLFLEKSLKLQNTEKGGDAKSHRFGTKKKGGK